MSRKKKIIYRSLFTILVLLLVFLFFLPTLIKNYAIKNGKELTGRQINIGNLKYNYFSNTLQVYDFKMFEANEKDNFTTFDTLIVNIEPYRFLFNEKVVEKFYIRGLTVNTILQDSTFNFDDLIAFHLTETDTVTTEDETVFKYDISNIELKDANFYFDNRNVNNVTHIDGFSFFIPNIGWNQQEKSNADIKFNFKNGGYFQSTLNVNPVDGEFDTFITLKNLNLEPFYEYLLEYANINSFEGSLNSQIKIEGNTNQPTNAIVSGHIDITNFLMTDTNDKKILASKRIDCNFKKIDYANNSYVLDSLKLMEPYLYFKMDSITNNLFTLFKIDPNGESTNTETTTEVTDTTATNLYYAINNLEVNNGIMDYSDNLTGEPFNYHLSEIKINTADITSDAAWLDIYSTMLLNERGTLVAKLGFNPSNYYDLDLDLTIKDFLLSDINVYAKHYTGHNILVGDFFYFSKSKITNGNIVSENLLRIENVDVTNTKKGLYSLPLKFALFLLKDKNGDVNMQLPVRGNLNEPEINIGKIIWTTIKKKITGTVSSPINSLASLVNVDPKDYEEILFEYQDTVPNEAQKIKLGKLLEMEKQKAGLKINLIQFVDPELQKEAILNAELGKLYFNETSKSYLDNKKDFKNYIIEKAANDSLNFEEASLKLLEPENIDDLVESYNISLKNNINTYLKSADAKTHIEVKRSELKASDNKKSKNRFEIKFDMLDMDSIVKDTTKTPN